MTKRPVYEVIWGIEGIVTAEFSRAFVRPFIKDTVVNQAGFHGMEAKVGGIYVGKRTAHFYICFTVFLGFKFQEIIRNTYVSSKSLNGNDPF